MYNSRIQYALENFIEENYFLPMSYSYMLKEKDDLGKSLLKVTVAAENICIEDYDGKKKCGFLKEEKRFGMKKSVDHFLLKNNGDNWDLYMIEMKSTVGDKKWREIKGKIRASLLNIRALCEVLGISIGAVYTYTTYEKESFGTQEKNPDPKTYAAPLGEKISKFKQDEWDKNLIKIKIDEEVELPHKAIKMIRDNQNVLQGELQI